MSSRLWILLSSLILLASCATQQQPNLITEFYDISDSKFSLRAIAPPATVRELAVCKAIWFAEKKNVRTLSLSNPAYSPPTDMLAYAGKVPPEWVILTTTAYLTAPNPDGNPNLSVTERAKTCRSIWNWYQ